MGNVTKRADQGRNPSRDSVWSPAVAEQVLEMVGQTGSPALAAKELGISTRTIHDHRKRDIDFGDRYQQAMDAAFHGVLGRAFERSMDHLTPSDRLIEVLLKFRWPERLNGFLALNENTGTTEGPAGLDPHVIAKMDPQDRAQLAELLGRYVDVERSNQDA
jgi:hypothetical protein